MGGGGTHLRDETEVKEYVSLLTSPIDWLIHSVHNAIIHKFQVF